MRDPKRIDKILDLIRDEWKSCPDYRFMQLIYNLQHLISRQNGDFGQVKEFDEFGNREKTGFDMFYLEDDKLIELLQKNPQD
jgi:hypothetical protein